MIKTLELKNWRTHKQSIFEFGKGTNVIIGVMGSGKSSIMNALSYSLFGNFPSLKSKQVSLNEIIMNKPNPCIETETKLTFTNNEKEYTVQRIIKNNGTNEAKLFEGNMLIAGPKQKDVNEKIEKLLGLNYELFSRAAYSEQNEIDFFLKLTPSERKRKFDELLELEKYEIARKNAISLKNQFTRENKQQKEFIEQQKEIVKNYEENKILERIQKEKNDINDLKQQKEVLAKKTIEGKAKIGELEKKEIVFNQTRDEITKNSSKLETLIEKLEEKEKIDLIKINIELECQKKSFSELEKAIKENENQKSIFEEKQKKQNEELKVLNYRLKQFENEENEIKKISGKCPKCLRELTEEQKEKIIFNGRNSLKEIEKNINDIKKEEQINIEIINKHKKEIEQNKTKFDKTKEKIFLLERSKKEAQEIEQYKKEIELLKKQIPEKQKKIEELKFNKNDFEKAKKNYFEEKSLLNNVDEKILGIDKLIKSLEENIERITKIKLNIDLIEKKYGKFDETTKKLSIFENCLIATQNELRETLLETINEAMTQIWGVLYPYKDFVDAKLCVVENGYDLQVMTRNGNWTRVEGILSGGERSAAAICIRIAFALVLTKQLSIFILDEPTHNLDKNAITRLSEMLNNSLPELVEQIFVITHEKEMEKAATSTLYELQRNKDLDEATKIEVLPLNY